jgi:predicted aminopeptidase
MRALSYVLLASVLLAAGCSNISYYMQSIHGQFSVMQARERIEDVIADPQTSPTLRTKLQRVAAIRRFASRELDLPDNSSYRGYADVRRKFVVWNVFAAGEFSIEPRQWCFMIVGCVSYRGYFKLENAEALARDLRAEGDDVFVGGVPAYSTLGWFDDPVLSTFINYPDFELARLIFHELAHQVVYIRSESDFNESFAAAVEAEGVKRWIAANGDEKMSADFARSQLRRSQFSTLVLKYRDELAALYARVLPADEMRARKRATIAALQDEYAHLKNEWGGYAGYDRFFVEPNNAKLASVAIYTAYVPQFERMIASHHGDLAAFYAEVKALAALPVNARATRLAELAPER